METGANITTQGAIELLSRARACQSEFYALQLAVEDIERRIKNAEQMIAYPQMVISNGSYNHYFSELRNYTNDKYTKLIQQSECFEKMIYYSTEATLTALVNLQDALIFKGQFDIVLIDSILSSVTSFLFTLNSNPKTVKVVNDLRLSAQVRFYTYDIRNKLQSHQGLVLNGFSSFSGLIGF